jgi:hypothetical protein
LLSSANAYLSAVQRFGLVEDQEASSRHNLSLIHKFAALDRLNESVSQMNLAHYVEWDKLHATNPLYEIPNSIFTFKIQKREDFTFTITFLVEVFLSHAVSILDILGKDIVHAHDLTRRGLYEYANLRKIVDKHKRLFPGSPLAKLWGANFPDKRDSWVLTLRELRNHCVHEDVCGPVIQMGIMFQTKPEVLLDRGAFPSRVTDQQRAISNFCPTVASKLNQLASDTYSLMATEVLGAAKFPL